MVKREKRKEGGKEGKAKWNEGAGWKRREEAGCKEREGAG